MKTIKGGLQGGLQERKHVYVLYHEDAVYELIKLLVVIIDNPGYDRETTGDVEITLHEALFIRSGDNL